MAKYKTLKRSAGRHNFLEDKEMDFPADEAKLLLADGAIAEIDGRPSPAKLAKQAAKKRAEEAEAKKQAEAEAKKQAEAEAKKQADSKGG